MTSQRIVTQCRAAGFECPPAAAEALGAYLEAMLEENRHVNLTAVRDLETAIVFHAVDGLALLLGWNHPDPPERVLDIGTGNGFPGVVAAALWPHAEVVLCDRTRKKTEAIARALARTNLNASVAWQDLAQAPSNRPEWKHHFDLITARAVAEPKLCAQLATPCLTRTGNLILWTSADTERPSSLGHLQRIDERSYTLPEPAERERFLAVYAR